MVSFFLPMIILQIQFSIPMHSMQLDSMKHIDMFVNEVRTQKNFVFVNILFRFFLALDAFKRNVSPVIIDNTNTQAWEMKPYVAMVNEFE